MTWAALVGTILITSVFCYMPIRKILRENNSKIISLENENTLGDVDTAPGSLLENMTQESNVAVQDTKNSAPLKDTVTFSVEKEGQQLSTLLWRNQQEIYYVFLPGFAMADTRIRVGEIAGNGYFTVGSKRFSQGDVIEDISYEKAYEFSLYDGDDSLVMSGPLIFLCSSSLPMVSLTTESGSMEWIEEKKGNEERGQVTVLSEQGILLYQGNIDSISGRGHSTWGPLKKPFQFQLEQKADLFGFGAARGYNLLADAYDETKLRNQIVMGLASELGMAYVPQGQTVDLYCNGVYYGVYYLCEKVEIGESRVNIADMEKYSSVVYGKQETPGIETFSSIDGSRKWTDVQVEEADITGGYLFERELMERYETEISGFITVQGDAYVLQNPQYATEKQVNYIANLMQEFQDALEEKDGVNRETGKHYSDYIDVPSFVQKYLVEEISKNYDGGTTSSYFYKPSDKESNKIFAGPVWDYDLTFGNCNMDQMITDPMGITCLNDHVFGTEVFAHLYEKEEFYQQVVSLYEQKALPYLNELVSWRIDVLSARMRQAIRLDSIRWEELQNRFQYYEEYENDIRYLKYFIKARKDFLSQVWLEGEEYHSVTFMVDGECWKRIYVREGEMAGAAPLPARYNSLFMGWLMETRDMPYDEYKPVYEDVVFYATWQQLPEEDVIITS